MSQELLKDLKRIYRAPVKEDLFGKRDALPSEVQRVVEPEWPNALESHLPTKIDILVKDVG